jgi:hypothetical protein
MLRQTKAVCPLCSTYLYQPTDSEGTTIAWRHYKCVLCDAQFKRVGFIRQPNELVWIIAGSIFFTLSVVIVIALAIGANSTCADVRFDGEYFCADEGQANTWFDSGGVVIIRRILLIAVIFPIPATIAFVTTRYEWLLILPIALFAGLVLGILLGEWAVNRWYSEFYWENREHWHLLFACFITGAPTMCLVAFLAFELAASQPSRLHLKLLPEEVGQWPRVGGN